MQALPASTLAEIAVSIDYSTEWSVWEPPMKVNDDGEVVTFVFDMPEVPPHTLSMVVSGNAFTIFGYRPTPPGAVAGGVHYNGRFRRRVTLPSGVRLSAHEVKFWRGQVIIRFPR